MKPRKTELHINTNFLQEELTKLKKRRRKKKKKNTVRVTIFCISLNFIIHNFIFANTIYTPQDFSNA